MMDTKTEYVFFGDSFVKMFRLIRHSKLQTIGYKGASAKGLGRNSSSDNTKTSSRSSSIRSISSHDSNSNQINTARDIQYRLDRMKCLKECYFCFGQVDVHLSYYYKTYGGKQEQDDASPIDLDSIARLYVDFVANLHLPNMRGETTTIVKKTIMGIYPSAPEDEFFRQTLVVYGSLTEELAQGIPLVDILLQTRQDRVIRFNQILQQACLEKGIHFVNIFDKMCSRDNINNNDSAITTTDSANTTTGTDSTGTTTTTVGVVVGSTAAAAGTGGVPRLKDAYRDISKCNIHVVWETTLLLWMRTVPLSTWLSALAPPGLEQQLQATFQKYTNTKPWAEENGKNHVCHQLGIAAAVDLS